MEFLAEQPPIYQIYTERMSWLALSEDWKLTKKLTCNEKI